MKKEKMKNRLLTEIKNMKRLMGINEGELEDCESKLEDGGYVVYNPDEQKKTSEHCAGTPKMKCVIEKLKSLGVDESMISEPTTYGGNCYVYVGSNKVKPTDGNISIHERTWVFWSKCDEDKNPEECDVSYFRSIPTTAPDPTKPSVKYSQVHYKGVYTCNNNEFKWKNLNYKGAFLLDKYEKIDTTDFFDVKIGGNSYKSNALVNTNGEYNINTITGG